ncbi:MFS transporter [Peribacillus cavernae]|uniref:MFS transporter n=1 Tax=Peribacillus cavernae TaxID=1674310 RepID=A0A3S0VR18_9BACI|nr:MFS transporter [Peribacillus cavernae]MDQ0218712.1 MFS family permease [Peribacillus cavernae]RUQ30928.1 MFS transporter [Peribacillus cavernae]
MSNSAHSEVVPGLPDQKANNRQIVSATTASLLGWSFDLYDLFILLYVTPTIGALFFPSSNPTLSLAAVYASFAVTLLMRPLGSAIFGSYADKNGRKKAMTVAIVGVGLSTATFGLLPTVPQIGVFAAVIFLLLRMVQGIFVGGVVASTHTIGTESAPQKWRGLMSGLIGGGGAGLGALFASITFTVVSAFFPGEAFSEWGWRVMFFTGIIGSIAGLFVFRSLDESPLWKELKKEDKGKVHNDTIEQRPIKTLFTSYFGVLMVNLMIVIGGGSGYYLTAGFIPTFLDVINNVSPGVKSGVLIASSIATIVSALIVGHLSEIIGRKKTFLGVGLLNIIGLPFFYLALGDATTTASIYFYTICVVFLGNAAYAPVLIFLNERFPTSIRSTGTGLSWNMGFAVGGMMPTFVTLASGSIENIPQTLMYFFIAIFLLYIVGSIIIPETKGNLK